MWGSAGAAGMIWGILWVVGGSPSLGMSWDVQEGPGEAGGREAELSLPLLSPSSVQDYPKAGPERARRESEAADEEEEEES